MNLFAMYDMALVTTKHYPMFAVLLFVRAIDYILIKLQIYIKRKKKHCSYVVT